MVISNCEITGGKANVLKECVMSKDDPLYKEFGYHTGVDLETQHVYSQYDGTIVSIGHEQEGYSVIIQTGSSLCICYRWIQDIRNLRAGQTVTKQMYIGDVIRKVHVELYEQTPSMWPVRIGNNTWYKNDVMQIFNTGFEASKAEDDAKTYETLKIVEMSDYPSGVPAKVYGLSAYILSNNKGSD